MTPTVIDWSHRFDYGGPRSTSKIQAIFIHTTESPLGTPCENVANYQLSARNGSYHYLADQAGRLLRENTDDWIAWGTGNRGNDVGLHLSFVNYAKCSRTEWLSNLKMLDAGAWQVARWCKAYGIPARAITPTDLRNGVKGISTHDGARRAWGVTDHTDPGPGFPMDIFVNLVKKHLNPSAPKLAPTTQGKGPLMALSDTEQRELLSLARDIKAQLTGDPRLGKFPGFAHGGGRTLYDLAAAIAEVEGVTGTKDTK